MARVSVALCVALFLVAVAPVTFATWTDGPTFTVDVTDNIINTFVGTVQPTGQNQLTGDITFDKNNHTDAQGLKIQDITITYGPEDPDAGFPIEYVGGSGPGNSTYVQDPSFIGDFTEGLNIQFNAPAGYHFVSFQLGVAVSSASPQFNAIQVDGLGSSTVGSGALTLKPTKLFAEGLFKATNIYTTQITIYPNPPDFVDPYEYKGTVFTQFALDNLVYVLEPN